MDDGPVATLLIGAERQIRGRIDAKTGAVTRADPAEPDVDDLLDAAGEGGVETRGGGEVGAGRAGVPGGAASRWLRWARGPERPAARRSAISAASSSAEDE